MKLWRRKPLQVLITDVDSAGPARRIIVRPRRWLLGALFVVAGAFALGVWAGRASIDFNRLAFDLAHLQREHRRLQQDLAERDARLEMQKQTIAALRRELDTIQRKLDDAERELLFYKRVLNARKQPGLQIVQAEFRRSGEELTGRIALVKGGNRPRRMALKLRVRLRGSDGSIQPLFGDAGLPLVVETHAVIVRRWKLPQGMEPKSVEVVVLDRKDREIARTRVLVEGEP